MKGLYYPEYIDILFQLFGVRKCDAEKFGEKVASIRLEKAVVGVLRNCKTSEDVWRVHDEIFDSDNHLRRAAVRTHKEMSKGSENQLCFWDNA